MACLRRLTVARDGNVMLTFGLIAIPLIIGAGMAIDAGRAYSVKVRLGTALDAAALAVGSETNQTAGQLSDDLQHFFFANYPSSALGSSVAVAPVPADADMTASTVNYQATATVPLVFMPLIGINSVNVSVTAQTKKTTGLEIALVLDNTGSMLCGASDANCSTGVVASDTTCTNSSNNSRICTLINAAKTFMDTMTSAISASQQLYVSVVPYVTTVNVGSALCSSATNCGTHITTDSCSGDFTDLRGNIIPTLPLTGDITNGSTTVANISPGTSALKTGWKISGTGIPAGATISSFTGTSITLSANATLTETGNTLLVGPGPAVTTSSTFSISTTTVTHSATWSNNSKIMTGLVTSTLSVGMTISSGSGIPVGTTIASIDSSSQIHMSVNATSNGSGNRTFTSGGGDVTSGSKTISGISSTSNIVAGMGISGTGIPAGAYVSSVNSSSTITISVNATATGTDVALTLTDWGARTTNGSNSVTNVKAAAAPAVGTVVSGNGIPANTAVVSTSGNFTTGTGQITLCYNATAEDDTALTFISPVTYDSAYNTANPAGSSTTSNWGGCIVEPTSSGENTAVNGVLASSTANPDTTEPASNAVWYPYWWPSGGANSWPTVIAQSTATETQGNVNGEWLQQDGPNQGCPVPLVPLTDVTNTTGKTTIDNTIGSMWPRDAGGTQVHIGMAWGWRTLSPTGPFASNNGHPLGYSGASSTGWKKVVILMTDGEEEWPATDNMTGLGQIADGKIGTTSNTSTAVSNLDTRLSSVCTNMSTQGYIIYTIGLGPGGSSNTQLQNCAVNGGFYEAATPGNLQSVFNDIAKSLIALRLSQ